MLLFACYLAILFPYVSPVYRFPSEVQPWAALLAWFATLNLLTGGKFAKFRKSEWLLLAISIYFLGYVYMDAAFDLLFYLKKSGAFLLSLGIYWIAARCRIESLRRIFPLVVWTYFTFALLQYVSGASYVALATPWVPVRDIVVAERGAASLAPEATDFGLTAVYFMILTLLLHGPHRRPARESFRSLALFLVSLSCVVLSKSGSGIIAGAIVMFLMLVGATRHHGLDKRFFLAIGAAAVLFGFFTFVPGNVVEDFRGLRLLYTVLENPLDLLDTSFSYRLVHNVVGGLMLYESYGVGFGAGSFVHVAPAVYDAYDLGSVFEFNDWYAVAVPESLELQALGVMPLLMAEYGVIGLLFAAILFGSVWKSSIPYKFAVLALLGMTWLQSFPAGYPLFWLLAGLARNPMLRPGEFGDRKFEGAVVQGGPAGTR